MAGRLDRTRDELILLGELSMAISAFARENTKETYDEAVKALNKLEPQSRDENQNGR